MSAFVPLADILNSALSACCSAEEHQHRGRWILPRPVCLQLHWPLPESVSAVSEPCYRTAIAGRRDCTAPVFMDTPINLEIETIETHCFLI